MSSEKGYKTLIPITSKIRASHTFAIMRFYDCSFFRGKCSGNVQSDYCKVIVVYCGNVWK